MYFPCADTLNIYLLVENTFAQVEGHRVNAFSVVGYFIEKRFETQQK